MAKRSKRVSSSWWIVGSMLPLAVLAALLTGVLPDEPVVVPKAHFLIVSTLAAVSCLLAVVVLIGAAQIADVRVLALALAFLTLSGLFFVHGLATPGILAPGPNGWVGAAARIGLFAGAWFLAASTLEERVAVQRTLLRLRGRIVLVTGLLLLLTGLVAAIDLVTLRVRGPLNRTPLLEAVGQAVTALSTGWSAVGLGIASIALLLVTTVHYWRVERRWSSPLVRGLLVASVFLLQAQVSLLLAPVWHVSWWEYHVLLLLAFAASSLGLVREYALHRTWRGVLEGLLLRDALEHLERGYTEIIAALAAAVEAKDVYTKGHSVRVARLAALIARELGLPPERERILYQAAILHDLGKIGIPDSVLQKPGPLTPDEFALVREHPVRSWEIARQVRSFAPMLPAIRWHHERLDGSGYPDGLRGDEIPLDARILAVADVFDALTSARPYRPALSVPEALAVLRDEAGIRLDAACVAALERLVERYGPALLTERPTDAESLVKQTPSEARSGA